MDCPACGSAVTLEVGPDQSLSASLTEALLAADEDECIEDEDECIEVVRDCWDCGWFEERQVRVASIDTTGGDEAAVERAALVDGLTDELQGSRVW